MGHYLTNIKKVKALTWISEVKVILNVTRYIVKFPVLYPVRTGFFIITNKNPKQDDHGCLPHHANCWKADTNIRVFRIVTHLPEALYAAHYVCFLFRYKKYDRAYASR